MPIGVVPSPSRRLARIPLQPTRAVDARAAAVQHSPVRRQIRSVAYVDFVVAVSTVISCCVAGGGAMRRSFAVFAGQAPAAAAAARSVARNIGSQGTLNAMRL